MGKSGDGGRNPFTRAPFQRLDLLKLSQLKASWNLSEMGCYKTTTALWLAEELIAGLPQSATRPSILYLSSRTGKTPVLEVLPFVLPDWQHHLIAADGLTFLNEHKNPTGPALYLGHYDLLQKRGRFAKVLYGHKWSMVIADEAHKFKSPKTQTTRAVWKLQTKYKHLMTGSPFANNIGELYSLLHWLAPGEFQSYNEFISEYGIMTMNNTGYEKLSNRIPTHKVSEVKGLIDRFGVRHTKMELFADLPDLYPPEKLTVDLNATQRRMYLEFRRDMEAEDQYGEHILTPTELARLTRLRQLTAATPYKEDEYYDEQLKRVVYRIRLEEPSSKLDALMEKLEDTGRPMVIFSCFNDPLHLLRKRLDKKKITYIHMEQKDGDITRAEKVGVFQKTNTQVFMAGIKLAGESITLTKADTVVFIDREWNPQRNEQAIARCWRPGQKNAVQVIYIEARNTVDQKVEADIFGKMVTWNQIFN